MVSFRKYTTAEPTIRERMLDILYVERATVYQIASILGVADSTVRIHMERMQRRGMGLKRLAWQARLRSGLLLANLVLTNST